MAWGAGDTTEAGIRPDAGAVLALLACLAAAATIHFPLPLNHDAAWHFYASLRVLAGDELGREIFDINPPMSAWLFLPAALVVEATGLSPSVVFKAFTLLVSFIWALWTCRLAGAFDHGAPWRRALVIGLVLFVMPGYDFGQREQFVLALTLPYLALAVMRAGGTSIALLQAVLVGVSAGLGIGIKPYFVALPICIEFWLLLRTRRIASVLRPETVALAAVGVVYLGAVAVFAPAYYSEVVPDAMVGYGGFKVPLADFAGRFLHYLAFALGAIALAMFATGRRIQPLAAQATLTGAAGFAVAALMQQKGWAYQLYPVAALVVLAAATILARGDSARHPYLAGAVLLLAAAVLGQPAAFLVDGYSSTGTAARVAALTKVFRERAGPDETVFAFITSPRDVHPAMLESRRRWAGSTGVMPYLPAEVAAMAKPRKDGDFQRIVRVSDASSRATLRRIEQERPAVIVVDDRRDKLGMEFADFDYIAYFGKYPEFRALWSGYEEGRRIGTFRIFLRRSAAPVTRTADPPRFAGNG